MDRKNVIASCIAVSICASMSIGIVNKEWQEYVDGLVVQQQQTIDAMTSAFEEERTSWGEDLASMQYAFSQLQTQKENAEAVLEEVMSDGTWHMLEGIATAYSPFDNVSGIEADADPEYTSTGVRPGDGIIAVDPAKIPYGSDMIVIFPDGTKYYGTANDTGGALRDNSTPHIDIYKGTYAEAEAFGVKDVIILWR